MNKYTINPDENKHQFATRIVVTEDRPMNAKEIHQCVDERSVDVTVEEMQAYVCYAVKINNLDKTRVIKNHETGATHVVYHPLGQHPIGDEIPQPLFKKKKPVFIRHKKNMVDTFDPEVFAEELSKAANKNMADTRRPVIDFKGEDITPLPHSDQHAVSNEPVFEFEDDEDEVVAERWTFKPLGSLTTTAPTPVVKLTGMPSLILDAIAVYHGLTESSVKEHIIKKIQESRVNNKELFNALKELFE